MRLLANPLIVRMGLGLLVSLAAFVAGILGIRALRRKLVEEEKLPESLGGTDDATFAYSAVIQKLKQQKFELQNEHAAQKRRAKSSEQIAAAVIANLPCGVLFIGPNGLVKQANPAARQLLGYASPLGMSPDELFRDALAIPDSGEPSRLAEMVKSAMQFPVRESFECSYSTSTGEQRNFAITLIPLTVDDASGLACVVADKTPVAELKHEKLLHAELSAEMALHLRASLSAIRDSVQRIGKDQNDVATSASDIAAETDRIDEIVAQFLAESSSAKTAAAHA